MIETKLKSFNIKYFKNLEKYLSELSDYSKEMRFLYKKNNLVDSDKKILENEDNFNWIIWNEKDLPIGFCQLVKITKDNYDASIVIRDKYQNQGYGKKGIFELIEFAKKSNIKKLTCDIHPYNLTVQHIIKKYTNYQIIESNHLSIVFEILI